jgi:hypothetical protein
VFSVKKKMGKVFYKKKIPTSKILKGIKKLHNNLQRVGAIQGNELPLPKLVEAINNLPHNVGKEILFGDPDLYPESIDSDNSILEPELPMIAPEPIAISDLRDLIRKQQSSDKSSDHSDKSSDHSDKSSNHSDKSSDHSDKSNDHSDKSSDHSDKSNDHSDKSSDHSDKSSDHSDKSDNNEDDSSDTSDSSDSSKSSDSSNKSSKSASKKNDESLDTASSSL